MPQRHARHKSDSASHSAHSSSNRYSPAKPQKERLSRTWSELQTSNHETTAASSKLASLIEQDAPLQTHSGLVLMYGPFQEEMQPGEGRGVASWLRDCVRKHGLPSLVRYDYRHRAQILRRDQFQPWLEPLLTKIPS